MLDHSLWSAIGSETQFVMKMTLLHFVVLVWLQCIKSIDTYAL